jgi:hypothetical protein
MLRGQNLRDIDYRNYIFIGGTSTFGRGLSKVFLDYYINNRMFLM